MNGMSNNYDGIKTSIINWKEGVVDSMLIRLSDACGRKLVSNPNFKDGIIPQIWKNGGKMEWYVYKSSGNDYRQLIEQYLSVFRDMEMVQEKNCFSGTGGGHSLCVGTLIEKYGTEDFYLGNFWMA